MTPSSTRSTSTAAPNPWWVLALICLPVFIGSLDLTIVSAFLPEIVINLGLPLQTALDEAAWVVSGYLLAYAISMTFMGRISDLVGRRWVYVACLLIFIAGSVLVATAHQWPTDMLNLLLRRIDIRLPREEITLIAIIIGRVIQALGAGALVPVSLALVSDLFPPLRRAQPLGVVGAVDTLGWVLGHLYGGVLVNWFATQREGFAAFLASLGLNWPPPDWRTLFWINVPLTIIALVLTVIALRRLPDQRSPGRFDWLGTALITAALILLVAGLGGNVDASLAPTNLSDISQLPAFNGGALLLALFALLAFVLVESRLKDPLIDLRFFRRRRFAAGALINLLIGFCLMIGLVIVPILVNVRTQDVSRLSEAAFQAGVLLSALTVPMALAAVPGGWLSDRIGIQRTTLLGLALAMTGFLLVWQTWRLDLADLIMAAEMALVGTGIGLTFSPISAAVINAADTDKRGVASALVIILRLVGMTVAVASLTTIALYRVNSLGAVEVGISAADDPNAFLQAYAEITVRVLAELGLVGAFLSALALIPAALGFRQASDERSGT